MFVDSDDYVKKDICCKLVEKIKNDNSDFALCGYTKVFESYGIEKYSYSIVPDHTDILKRKDLIPSFGKMYAKSLFNTPFSRLYRLKIIKNNNITYDETVSLGEDLLFNLEYLKCISQISIVNESLYFYTSCDTESSSLTHKFRYDYFETQKKLRESVLAFLRQLDESPQAEFYVNKVFLKRCIIYVESIFHNKKICGSGFLYKYVKEVLNDNEVTDATRIKNSDLEAAIYKLLFKMKTAQVFIFAVIIRMLIKKLIMALAAVKNFIFRSLALRKSQT
jgi:hypothetical protein